nr:immunoglobulin heavy chain junction region [Mus musculus]
CARGLRYFDVW